MCRLSKWENWGGMSSWSQNLPSGPNGSVVGSDGPCRHATFSSVQNCSLHFRDTSYRLPGCSKFELFGKQVPFFLFLWQTKNNVIWWTCWGLHVRIAYRFESLCIFICSNYIAMYWLWLCVSWLLLPGRATGKLFAHETRHTFRGGIVAPQTCAAVLMLTITSTHQQVKPYIMMCMRYLR